ncbi:MAG: beta-xylosidase [Cellvibrio sp. 79]|nr:MAG: beta-xylosidase [Cellvibrio sp. 79]
MKLTSLALVMGGLLLLGGCGGGSDSQTKPTVPASETPVYFKPTVATSVPLTAEGSVNWQNVGVHDPSIVKDGSNYYIFGSHLAAAKSADLISWTLISSLTANNAVDESSLFQSYSSEIAEGIAWTDGYKGNWAADVIKAPNGKYWFYYNHCGQNQKLSNPDLEDKEVCNHRSYLGLAEADSIIGPYKNKGIFLRSGYRTEAEHASYPLDNGQKTYTPATDPNAIDPAAFFDKDGNLWMVYGSYSGGIFILDMDKTTGKPKAGQGYGKHLVGSDFRAIEGAFVMYSPVADYYYLFYSVAGFAINGGYNIRVARSKKPNGPYLDPAGNDISTIGGTLEIGGKLMGGFEFTKTLAEPAPAWGYQSPGHNSAYYDAATGRHLLVTHTRFPSASTPYPTNAEAHEVRVHEMFINKAGWLVSSPQRYIPLEGKSVVDVAQMTGYYKVVNHNKSVNTSAIQSEYVALNENRSVTGFYTGTWAEQGDNNIRLVLNSGVYNGVMQWQWDDGLKQLVVVFSAMSDKGETIWGSRVEPINATTDILNAVSAALEVKSEITIDDSHQLPVIGKGGTTIVWESSDEYFIEKDGSIFIPTPDLGDKTISLNAVMSLNGKTANKQFTVKLKARPAFKNAVAHYRFDGALTDSLGHFAAANTTDNNLLNTGATTPAYATGYAGQAFNFVGNNGVRLPDEIIKSNEYTVSFWLKPTELTAYTAGFFATTNADRWFSFLPDRAAHFTTTPLLWSRYLDAGNDNWNQIIHTSAFPKNQWEHVAITYSGGIMKLFINGVLSGSMPRADFFSAGGGMFALGVNYGWDVPFVGQIDEFIVYDYALSNLDINGAAINNLTQPSQFAGFVKNALDLGDVSAIRENFELPRVGPFVSGISWASDNEAFLKPVNGTAIVKQPTALQGDQKVTLTATIRYQTVTETKTFSVTVKSLAPAEYSFEGNLKEVKGAFAEASETGNRINNTGGKVTYVTGVKGSAVHSDGTAGIRLPDNLITTNSYSVSLWLKPDAFTNYTTAFFGGSAATAWISLVPSMNGSNKTRLWGDMGGYFDKGELATRIPDGKWTHVAFTVDGDKNDTLKIYINGALQLDVPGVPRVFTVVGETTEFALGVNYWDTPFNGAYDELKVYTGAITAESITALYQEGADAAK